MTSKPTGGDGVTLPRFTATGFNQNNQCAEVTSDDYGAWVLIDDARCVIDQLTARNAELEAQLHRRTVECQLKSNALDRWVPCPDHRDKTERGVCLVCAKEKLEAQVERVRGLAVQWRHNAQGCNRKEQHAAGTWRSCARELTAIIQPKDAGGEAGSA